MKKFLVLGFLLITSTAFADPLNIGDVAKKLPELKQGIAYSLQDSKLNYLSTIELASYRNFSLETGYAGAAENTKHKIVGVLSYNVGNLKDKGVNIPLAEFINFNIGLYAGYGNINMQEIDRSEFDWGASATLISLKF